MTCPKCSHLQPDGQPSCQKCGVIFAKLSAVNRPVAPAPVTTPLDLEDLPPEDTEGWAPSPGKLLFAGALLAGVVAAWFLILEASPGKAVVPNSYQDANNGFSIRADPSWIMLTKANYKEVLQQYGRDLPPQMNKFFANDNLEIGFLKIQAGGFPPSLNVVVMPLKGAMPELTQKEMEQGAAMLSQEFSRILPDYVQESVRGVEVDGLKSMQVVSRSSIRFKISEAEYEELPGAFQGTTRIGELLKPEQFEDYSLRFVQTLVPGKGRAYIVTVVAAEDPGADLDGDFARALDSFRVAERPPRFGPVVTGSLRGALVGMGLYFLYLFGGILWKLLER